MENSATSNAGVPAVAPRIRELTLDHPWQWLAKGWADIERAPVMSLLHGAVFVVVSYLLTFGLINGAMFFLLPPLAAGFFLVAPFLGIALYGISRSLQQGETPQFCLIMRAWRSNPVHLSAMALTLMMVLLVWMLAANLVFALFFDKPIPTWENFIPVVFLSGGSPVFLFAGIVSGAVIAFFAFCISVITVPILMDRQVDVVTAMHASVTAVRKNPGPMLLWASLIVMFVGVGIATLYIGLAVAMPLVGHATWHAYQDLVAPESA